MSKRNKKLEIAESVLFKLKEIQKELKDNNTRNFELFLLGSGNFQNPAPELLLISQSVLKSFDEQDVTTCKRFLEEFKNQ